MSEDSVETKDRILAAATELFALHGFDGVSVRMIADKAGANISLVSYYFGGKEGLYRSCLDEHARSRLVSFKRILVRAKSPEEVLVRLEMIVSEMIHSYIEHPHVTKMVHKEFERLSAFACDVFKGTFLEIFQDMQKFFKDAVEDGFIRREVEPFFLCSFIMGAVSNAMRMDALSKNILNVTLEDEGFRQKFIRQLSLLVGHGFLKG